MTSYRPNSTAARFAARRNRVGNGSRAAQMSTHTVVLLSLVAAALLALVIGATVWMVRDLRTLDCTVATVVRVVDGDTIVVSQDGQEASVRLIGIDCPESVSPDADANTPEGDAASAFTASVISAGQTVYLVRDKSDTDKYGRLLRYVWLEIPDNPRSVAEVRTKMLQGIILDAGHAVAKRYTPDTAYATIFERIEATAGK